MKTIVFLIIVSLCGYLAFRFTPAGQRAQMRMTQKSSAQAATVPSRNPKYAEKGKEELMAELKFNEEVVAAIKEAADGKPVVVAACGMTRTATITPALRLQLNEFESDIRSLKAEIATRR